MKLIKTIQQKYIADAKDVFTSYVDNDFRNWNTNKGDELAVCEKRTTYEKVVTWYAVIGFILFVLVSI